MNSANQTRQTNKPFVFTVDGMHCASCVAKVEKALMALSGVQTATVNFANKRATVDFSEPRQLSLALQAIQDAGFQPRIEQVTLKIEAMSCASCVHRIEKALVAVRGVVSAEVNFATQKADVVIVPEEVALPTLILAIEDAGYTAKAPTESVALSDQPSAEENEIRSLRTMMLLASAFTLPVFILEMGSHMVPSIQRWVMHELGMQTNWIIQFLLTTVVLTWPGSTFFKRGIPTLIRRSPDMNSLVALGAGAAWIFSSIVTFVPQIVPDQRQHVYFEAAAIIVTFILIGRFLEAKAKGKTSEAVRKLVSLQVKEATVMRGQQATRLPIEQVREGDFVLVKPGEKIPLDGVVTDGESYVDEAMITGEAMPVAKEAESQVVGGTLNKNGALTFRVTKIGKATLLAQIIQMVEQAQGAKLPIQALVDRVTAVFVPVVLACAALTFVLWFTLGPEPQLAYALVNAVAVLIVACPCAMGLATPTSIMVGTGRAASLGVLFRKGTALQSLQDIQVLAFDKTGTLTQGKPKLTDFELIDPAQRDPVLRLIASLEAQSEHPIAEAIVKHALAKGLKLERVAEFEAKPGFGVTGLVAGKRVMVGADRLLRSRDIDISAFENQALQLADQAKTPLYAAIDQQLVALIAVADPIKEHTPAALEALRQQGLKIAMITGDSQPTAKAIAKQLDIDFVVAEVLPQGKVDALAGLHKQGQKIAFIGDGINDAPALASADVGIAIGTGTDVAIESAEIVLMSGDLRGVVTAFQLSKATMRNIKQNLFWAFAYNVLLIPIAAGLLYPAWGILLSPIFAAASMAASSVCVLTNALRLRFAASA